MNEWEQKASLLYRQLAEIKARRANLEHQEVSLKEALDQIIPIGSALELDGKKVLFRQSRKSASLIKGFAIKEIGKAFVKNVIDNEAIFKHIESTGEIPFGIDVSETTFLVCK